MSYLIRNTYQHILTEHFKKNRQMLFLMGPRQVGKTTLTLQMKSQFKSDFFYFNWDNIDDREVLLSGPKAIAEKIQVSKARKSPPLVVFDEIHKYKDWKTFLKGFFDTYSHSGELRIIVTGSARLDSYSSGGDSLMGRYFKHRIHPFTVGEILENKAESDLISLPSEIDPDAFNSLLNYGGFPEPYLKADSQFFQQWSTLRMQQLFYEDIREITRIHEIKQMELLGLLIRRQAGSLTNFASLSKHVRVSDETIRRWVHTFNLLYYCFQISPWSKNITRSLLKEPKLYLWDWALSDEKGQRAENFVASHLLKACQLWTDRGFGNFGLYFLRDKEKREVDFLVSRNAEPWFIAEVKHSSEKLSPSLSLYQKQTGAKHAFQVVIDENYEDVNCFDYHEPVIVPAKTFLSQLV